MIPDWVAARLRAQQAQSDVKPRPKVELGQRLETVNGPFMVTAWNWPTVCGIDNEGEAVFATYDYRGGWNVAEYVDGKWAVMSEEEAA